MDIKSFYHNLEKDYFDGHHIGAQSSVLYSLDNLCHKRRYFGFKQHHPTLFHVKFGWEIGKRNLSGKGCRQQTAAKPKAGRTEHQRLRGRKNELSRRNYEVRKILGG